ncbi:recombinase family protein [Ferrimonas sp. YFM]|uniref:recombinase family protein n=1 Tax=Ferrimonas sp. YFM TaxID=3028878 RepID=UPI0025738788|nr:recombinase family protein [Ferrimonas sp. YFM]BDY05387.1 hypothetical protein F0521_24280 [Ferrimonas sp. YFM]
MNNVNDGRTYSYLRVSTMEQTVENQRLALESRGFKLPDHRVISETVSGGVCALERPQFRQLVEHKLEPGDTLVVLKLDRLGRDTIDVLNTVTMLKDKGVRVVSLDLGEIDLTSAAGKLQLTVMAAVAEMERQRIKERTQEGLARAKAEGKALGRPKSVAYEQVQELKAKGYTQKAVWEELDISKSTVQRNWK